MIEILPKDFHDALDKLATAIALTHTKREQKATPEERTALLEIIDGVRYQCIRLHIREVVSLCDRLNNQLKDPSYHGFAKEIPLPALDSVYWQLQGIASELHNKLNSVRFAGVPLHLAAFFERDNLLGDAVRDAASMELNGEIRAAGNCLAMDLNTAAVFHLMRVAEHGLHRLAADLNVAVNPYPLRFSEWRAVIERIRDELDNRVKLVQPMPRGPLKEQDYDYYLGLLNSLTYFKEAYRNPVSHLRGNYDANKAKVIFNEVKDFMQRLASRVPLK